MTTRLDLRNALRLRLEDTALNPLWPDSLLNAALHTGLLRLGTRLPLEASLAVPIAAGTRAVALSEAMSRNRVRRVLDERGEAVPEAIMPGPDGRLTWRLWDDTLQLSSPLAADATWTVEYRAARALPADDVSALPVAADEEPILLALAMETVLRTRAVEEMKRMGNSRAALALADSAMQEAEALLAGRRRTVRSHVAAPA